MSGLKKARLDLGWSIKKMACELFISESAYRKYEKDPLDMPPSILKLAHYVTNQDMATLVQEVAE